MCPGQPGEEEVEVEHPFCAADMMQRLRDSPQTKAYMEDSAFVAKLEELSKKPSALMK